MNRKSSPRVVWRRPDRATRRRQSVTREAAAPKQRRFRCRRVRRLFSETLDGDVRKHLALSAAVIAELMADRRGRAWVVAQQSSLAGSGP